MTLNEQAREFCRSIHVTPRGYVCFRDGEPIVWHADIPDYSKTMPGVVVVKVEPQCTAASNVI